MCDLNNARNFASCVMVIDSVFADERFFKLFHCQFVGDHAEGASLAR